MSLKRLDRIVPFARRCAVAALMVTAASAHATGFFIQKTTVTRLVEHDRGDVLVYVSATPNSTDGCAGNNYVVLQKANTYFTQDYAALLLAAANGMTFGGFIQGCDANYSNRPILIRVDLLPNASVTYP